MLKHRTRFAILAAMAGALLALAPTVATASDTPTPAPGGGLSLNQAVTPALGDGMVTPLALASQSFTGDFKASLRSRTFYPNAKGTISAWVVPTNCTAGYSSITVNIYNVTVVTQVISYGKQTVPCGSGGYVSWPDCNWGAYQLQFDRIGPAGKDENTKHVTGTIYFNN